MLGDGSVNLGWSLEVISATGTPKKEGLESPLTLRLFTEGGQGGHGFGERHHCILI